MTLQASEVLIYRNEEYLLSGNPLMQYLEKNSHIKFEEYSTAHWCGYQGYWLLENNKLYLTKLESTNYTIRDLFNTNEPVLAEWFSGILKFGIGYYHPNKWYGFYDNYVWLNIENGIIIEKKIVKLFFLENEIEFGKYKGRKFVEVVSGKIRMNTYTTLRNYIQSIFNFLTNADYKLNVLCPSFEVTEQDIRLIKEIKNSGIEFFLTQSYIATSTKVFWENSDRDTFAEDFSNLLEKILSSNFNNLVLLKNQRIDTKEIDEDTILINPDINYLVWALKTVDNFYIPPSDANEEFRLTKLKTLKIKRLNKWIFEYEPVIEIVNYKFPEKILKLNQEKFEKNRNVLYEPKYDIYLLNISEKKMYEKFGHYLDENYVYSEEDYDESSSSFYKESNDWLIDASGSDDPETMNDLYWNID